MTDIVERLRRTASLGVINGGLMREAADEIERLRRMVIVMEQRHHQLIEDRRK